MRSSLVNGLELMAAFITFLIVTRWLLGFGTVKISGEVITFQSSRPLVEDEICKNLRVWIESNGGKITNVACNVQPESGGRGIIVTDPLPYKQVYITVPPHLWLHEATIKANSSIRHLMLTEPLIIKECGKTFGSKGEPCRLILAMMFERVKKDSFYKAYLDSMPEVPTSPLWWNDAQLDALETPVLTDQVKTLQEYLRDMHTNCVAPLSEKYPKEFPADRMTLELLTWAALNVWGRAFDSTAMDPKNKNRRTWGMIPFADLVNHGSYVESFYGDNKGKGPFMCWATECLSEGAEILQSYGSHRSSGHYFLYYGFVPEGYLRADYVSFRVSKDAYHEVTKIVTAKQGRPKYTQLIGHAGIDGRITETFLTSYRKILNYTGSIPRDDLIKTGGMKTTLQALGKMLDTALANFKSTREEDFTALSKGFETYDKWVALTVKSRYKMLLERVRDSVKHRLTASPTSPSGWKIKKLDGLLVYDDDEVNVNKANENAKDALFVLDVPSKI